MHTPINDLRVLLVADHTIGDNELTVSDVSRFGTPTPENPVRVSVGTSIFSITGITGSTLEIGAVLEDTSDSSYLVGASVEVRFTAGTIQEIHDVIAGLVVGIGHSVADGDEGSMLYVDAAGNLAQDTALIWNPSTNTLTVDGTINADNITGSGLSLSGVVLTSGDQQVQGKKSFVGAAAGSGIDRWAVQTDDLTDLVKIDKDGTLSVQGTGETVDFSAGISNVELTSTVATVICDTPHNFKPGYIVTITGLTTSDLNGSYVVVTTPADDTFTFTKLHADIASTPDSGTVSCTLTVPMQEFKDAGGNVRSFFTDMGGLHLAPNLPGASARWGDHAALTIRQNNMGQVAFGIYDSNFLFNETSTKTNLSLQTYFLDDGSYYSGRSFIVSQDRNKVTGEIAQMGGQTMVGASGDINAPVFKSANQLNLPGEAYRYCYAAIDAADTHPLYPAGGVYSDRGCGKTKWVVGPAGETLWGPFLNPDGDSSDPEEHRLAKLWLSTTTNHLTVESSGQTATTSYFDVHGPTGGNAIFQLGSRGVQDAFWIGTSASTTGFANFNLGSHTIMRFYDNPGGLPGVSVAINADDNTSALTVDGGTNNASVAIATFRGVTSQTGDLIRAQDKDLNTLWHVAANGRMGASVATPTAQVHAAASSTTLTTAAFQAVVSQSSNLTEWRNTSGTPISAVTAAGAFGIGTASPAALFEVKKSSGGTIASFGANSTSDILTIGYEQSGLIGGAMDLTSSAFGPFVINSQSSNNILLLPHGIGRVGINEATPTGELQVTTENASTKGVVVKGATTVATVNNVALTSNVATLTTAAAHNLATGQNVTVAGLTNTVFNGSYVITGTPTSTTFTYARTNTDISSTADAGTVTGFQRVNLQEWQDSSGTILTYVSNTGYMRVGTNAGLGDSNAGLEVCYGANSALNVVGSGFPALKVASTTNTVIGKFQAIGSSNYCGVGTETNHATKIITNNTARLNITNNGLVGINVDASAAQLEVVTSATGVKGAIVKATSSSVSVSNVALTSNVATLTTSAAHGFAVGQIVVITGLANTLFNGTYTIASVPTTTTFTYAKTNSNVTSVADSGTAVGHQLANIQEWQGANGTAYASVVPMSFDRFAVRAGGSAYTEISTNSGNFPTVKGSANGLTLDTNGVSSGYGNVQISTHISYGLRITAGASNVQSTTDGRLCVETGQATNKGVVIRGFTSQSAVLFEAQSASGMVASIDATGLGTFAGGAVLATAALATTATAGFTYLPTCAGTPTGTPGSKTGTAPVVIDTTNSKLYFYSGGSWVDSTAGGGVTLGPTLTALETTAFAADDATETFDLSSNGHIRWSSTSAASGTKDVGLKRTGPGELAITDGGSGIADLEVDELVIGTLTGMIKGTSGTLSVATEGTDYLSGASNKLPLPYSFGGAGVPTIANDVTPWVYVSHDATVVRFTLSCKGAPSGDFQVTIKKSTDSGSTFPTTVATVTVSSGGKLATTTSITGASLTAGDYLRCDVISVNGADTWSARLETLSKNV